jgi:pimeloyl-ACP methyl ester carboxylesterase
LLLAALPAALALAGSSAASASVSFVPCAQDPSFSCATLPVPVDRTGALPGTISLGVERRSATSGPTRTAVVALAGGPGQPALPFAHDLATAMGPALATRDLIVFDQRGTGTSGPLNCAALDAPKTFGELAQQCAQELGPARGDYNTGASVEDIEAIRQATGYEDLVLYGTSYGTKVALEYAARYPQHVESLVLDSVEPAEGPDPFDISTFKAIGPVLAELCSHRACAGVSASPLADLARLVGELSVRPLSAAAYDGHGKRVRVSISPAVLLELLRAGDLNPAMRAELPAAIRSALAHDPARLARMLELASIAPPASEGATAQIDQTLFLDTVCEDAPFPWRRAAPEATRAAEAEAALGALPRSDFYPFAPEAALFNVMILTCIAWPGGSASSHAPAARLPNVPTLLLAGGQDLRTPTENAAHVASEIPDAQLLRVPYTGHSVIGSDLSGCASTAVAAFFAGRPVKACASPKNHFPPAPLAPTSLSTIAPAHSVPAAQGRTVTAVVDSLLDLRRTLVELALDFGELPSGAAFGGLRGGSVEMSVTGATLRRFAYVPGVTLSGFIPTSLLTRNVGASATVAVGGRSAASGSLRIAAGGRLSGVLGGRALHLNITAKVRVAAARARAGASTPGGTAAVGSGPLRRLALLR